MTQHVPTADSAPPALRFASRKFGSRFDESDTSFALTFISQHLVKTGGTTNVTVCLHERLIHGETKPLADSGTEDVGTLPFPPSPLVSTRAANEHCLRLGTSELVLRWKGSLRALRTNLALIGLIYNLRRGHLRS